jgi:hypothetical protein
MTNNVPHVPLYSTVLQVANPAIEGTKAAQDAAAERQRRAAEMAAAQAVQNGSTSQPK